MEVSINESDPDAEAVKTMRRLRKAIGHKTGVPDYEVELQVKQTIPPEVDWFGMKRRKELLQLVYQEAAGRLPGDRYVIEDALITEVSRTGNAQGEADMTVKLLPLDHRKEN